MFFFFFLTNASGDPANVPPLPSSNLVCLNEHEALMTSLYICSYDCRYESSTASYVGLIATCNLECS